MTLEAYGDDYIAAERMRRDQETQVFEQRLQGFERRLRMEREKAGLAVNDDEVHSQAVNMQVDKGTILIHRDILPDEQDFDSKSHISRGAYSPELRIDPSQVPQMLDALPFDPSTAAEVNPLTRRLLTALARAIKNAPKLENGSATRGISIIKGQADIFFAELDVDGATIRLFHKYEPQNTNEAAKKELATWVYHPKVFGVLMEKANQWAELEESHDQMWMKACKNVGIDTATSVGLYSCDDNSTWMLRDVDGKSFPINNEVALMDTTSQKRLYFFTQCAGEPILLPLDDSNRSNVIVKGLTEKYMNTSHHAEVTQLIYILIQRAEIAKLKAQLDDLRKQR